ncbi:MAG: molybdopterin-dependent oxidoreductase [Betaproteobacteria bacterium]|nr:molybdopterin-dependent oxidoreductase [Betaproteobacteria bacterium]
MAQVPSGAQVLSVCCYCGVGCGVVIQHDGTRITGVSGDADHPANFGRLCSKGSTLHLTGMQTTRALYPELRLQRETHAAPRQRVSWELALDHAAERFAQIIREHGADAVAFYVSGQLLTEDYYVFNKLARALVGTNNIDSNSRLCMSSAVSAYKRTLGADAPPTCYEDLDLADCVLIAGSNTAYAHPIAFRRVLDARAAHPERKLIVIDPRITDTAAAADIHLQIEPGTDCTLFGAMLHVLIRDGLIDDHHIAAHTSGFEQVCAAVRTLTPDAAAHTCGLGPRGAEDIVTAAHWFGQAGTALSLWCQGLNQSQHGSDNGAALIHLHLASGHIGKPGSGPFSLTGQPNAMGGREVGAMANLLGGHRDPADPVQRAEMAELWGIPALPATPGKTAVEMFEGLRQGNIKAVWIACTNPAQSLPDQAHVREALSAAEFVVLQEAYNDTETAAYADLLLPAATWGEKDGAMSNSERRITRVRAAIAPPGEARADWTIARDFALRLGERLGREDVSSLFGFSSSEEVFEEHAATTVGRDLDIGGLNYDLLESAGPQQWPLPAGSANGRKRLYADHRYATVDGRARFVGISLAATAEAGSARYPLHLNSGRLRDQWHGMSRTGKLAQLMNHAELPNVSIHPDDIDLHGLKPGELVSVTSRRGKIVMPVAADATLKPGHAFIPMHWGRRRLSHSGVNELIAPALDPYSKQPELKHAAISLSRAALPWRGLLLRQAISVDAGEQALAWDAALGVFLAHFDYASLTLAGRDSPLLALHLASAAPPGAELLAAITAAAELSATPLHYDDAARGIHKRALIENDRLTGVLLFGETAAGGWLRASMLAGQPAAPLRRWLFAPLAGLPIGMPARGRIICNCHDVAEDQISAAIASGAATLALLQTQLPCGSGCGACIPELNRMLAITAAPKLRASGH